LPSIGRVRLRISARWIKAILEKSYRRKNVSLIDQNTGDIIVGFEDDETLERVLESLNNNKNKPYLPQKVVLRSN
jgi:nicotinamide-nucleotide amidase